MATKKLNLSQTPTLKFLPVRKKDLPSLLELEKRLFPIDHWSEEIFIDEMKKDPHAIKVAKIGNDVIGYVHTEYTDKKLRDGAVFRVGEIGSIAVHEDHRGKKLGEKLVSHGIRRLRKKDTHKIILHTRLDNIPMQKLAATKFGFKTTKIHKNAYDDGASAYVMVLDNK